MIRRFVVALSLLVLSVTSWAQLTMEEKRDVLRAMDRVLAEEAFVPGVDLRRWPDFMEQREGSLEEADTHNAFSRVVNGALKEFGISHIQVSRAWRRGEVLFDESTNIAALIQQGSRRRTERRDSVRWVDDEAAVIRINTFTRSYEPENIEELFREASDAKYLVLDLRSNPGGRVDYMDHLLSFVLPANTPVGTFISRRTAMAYSRALKEEANDPVAIAKWTDRKYRVPRNRLEPFKGQIAVLVDSRSASASEIVASALRENRSSVIVGTPTAGAVLMSTFSPLPHGFQIQYPISDYVSIRGERLEGRPLRPDISLEGRGSETDAVLVALERMRSGR